MLVVVHDEKAQSEEHGKDTIHLAGEQPGQHAAYLLVARQCIYDRLLGKDVEMLYGVLHYDSSHRNAPQGVGHVDPGVGKIVSMIHMCFMPV